MQRIILSRKASNSIRMKTMKKRSVFSRKPERRSLTHPVAAFYLGLTYKQLKEYRLAEKNLRDSLQLTPPVKDAYLELAEVLYTLEQYNEAEGWVVKAEQEGVKPAKCRFHERIDPPQEGQDRRSHQELQ